MAGEAAREAFNGNEQYIQLIQDVTNVEGQRYREGDVLIISSVNARRPGEHVDNIYCMCPIWFDYITPQQAASLLQQQAAAREAAEAARLAEEDPLAGLGL